MVENIQDGKTLPNLCGEVVRKIQNESGTQEFIKELLDLKFEVKMTENYYTHYQL